MLKEFFWYNVRSKELTTSPIYINVLEMMEIIRIMIV